MHRDFFFGVASPRSLVALRFVSPWHPRCFVLNALCTRPLSIFSYCCFLPLSLSFLFCSLHCIVPQTPPDRGRSRAFGSSGWLRCRSLSDPPVRLCRVESHSGASLPAWLRARSLSVSLSHSLTPLASFSSFLLAFASRIRIFATLPPFPQIYCFLFIPSLY